MVISALTISFPASLPGAGIQEESQGDGRCPRAGGRASPSRGCPRPQGRAGGGKPGGCWHQRPHTQCDGNTYGGTTNAHVPAEVAQGVGARWLAVVGAEQLPFLQSPRLCNQSPKLSENSGNEFFGCQLIAFELLFT